MIHCPEITTQFKSTHLQATFWTVREIPSNTAHQMTCDAKWSETDWKYNLQKGSGWTGMGMGTGREKRGPRGSSVIVSLTASNSSNITETQPHRHTVCTKQNITNKAKPLSWNFRNFPYSFLHAKRSLGEHLPHKHQVQVKRDNWKNQLKKECYCMVWVHTDFSK